MIALVAQVAQPVVLAWGWRRAAIAALAGAASTLAFAPLNVWPALFLTFPIVVWLIDGSGSGRWNGARAAASAGWWFGFGFFLAGLYWIGAAFLVDAEKFAVLMPFAVVALPAGLALFMALGFGLARLLWSADAGRVVTLAAALTLTEWLRGTVLTGFPWNTLGYALTGSLPLAQGASLVGIFGLTFLAVLIFASPAVLADEPSRGSRPWLLPAGAVALLAGLALFGAVRLQGTTTTFVDGVKLRIMQPNVPQDRRFAYAAKMDVMQRYVALSSRQIGGAGGQEARDGGGLAGVTHLIWPESAFPFFLAREADALAIIAELIPEGTVLITGAARLAEGSRPGHIRAYNSVYVIDHLGTIQSVYDKVHLVPFGEFVPLRWLLERLGVEQLVRVPGGFVPGTRLRTIDTQGAPAFVPLVCYEAIFSRAVVPPGERPGWLVNVTNDAWFGLTSGPFQHMQQARIRAIEEGLPLVRAANTGVSGVVDPLGRTISELGLGREGVIDAALPTRIAPPLFARIGNVPLAVVVAGALCIAAWRRRRGTPSY